MPVAYTLFETDFGFCGVAWSDAGLVRLQLPERDKQATEARLIRHWEGSATPPPAPIAGAIEELARYFSGEAVTFAKVPLDLSATQAFHRTIYDATLKIGWGQTKTYGALAAECGSPGAARAVGQAMGRNPIPIIIPCHRVLAAGQRMGGFSAYGGTLAKERLLAMEGVYLDGGTPLLPGLFSD